MPVFGGGASNSETVMEGSCAVGTGSFATESEWSLAMAVALANVSNDVRGAWLFDR